MKLVHSTITRLSEEALSYRAVPFLGDYGSVGQVSLFGVSSVNNDTGARKVTLPQSEELYLGYDGTLYACTPDGDALVVSLYRLAHDKLTSICEPIVVPVGDIPMRDLLLVAGWGGLEVWRQSFDECRCYCIVTSHGLQVGRCQIKDPPEGELSGSFDDFVVFKSDLGVDGNWYTVCGKRNGLRYRLKASCVFGCQRYVVCAVVGDPAIPGSRHGLVFIGINGRRFISCPGPIIGGGGDRSSGTIVIYLRGDAHLHVVECLPNDEIRIVQVSSPSGFKTLSLDGKVYSVRGFDRELRVYAIESPTSSSVPAFTNDYSRVVGLGELVVSRCLRRSRGTVIHFHGGPESFEVPEPRYFGLPQWCNDNGIDWIGVNYPGSLSESPEEMRRVWRGWREPVVKACRAALIRAGGPVVLVGWSFGATIALACAALSPQIKGVLMGGACASLPRHVRSAVACDPAHRSWFVSRFSLAGDDGDFFSGMNGWRPDVKILEIHGANDMACPIENVDRLADDWSARGNPWRRVDLPGGGHYVESWDDVRVVYTEMRKFLSEVLSV